MFRRSLAVAAAAMCAGLSTAALAAEGPDYLASFFAAQMTQAEKLALVDGFYGVPIGSFYTPPAGAIGSAGFVAGATRLGLPNLQESDAGLGVADPVPPGLASPVRGGLFHRVAFTAGHRRLLQPIDRLSRRRHDRHRGA
jgi:hypothetical protein